MRRFWRPRRSIPSQKAEVVDRLFEKLTRLIERALAVAFAFAVVLNFVNVVNRYVFNASILSADEIEIYIMVWITFLGAVVVTWRRQHLRMDVLLQSFPRPLQMLLHAVELLLMAGLCGFMLVNSWNYAALMYAIGRTSDNAGIPLWMMHAALALGFGLMAGISAWRLVAWLGGGREPIERMRGAPE
jgi:TRAP-type transport system small permease protein